MASDCFDLQEDVPEGRRYAPTSKSAVLILTLLMTLSSCSRSHSDAFESPSRAPAPPVPLRLAFVDPRSGECLERTTLWMLSFIVTYVIFVL